MNEPEALQLQLELWAAAGERIRRLRRDGMPVAPVLEDFYQRNHPRHAAVTLAAERRRQLATARKRRQRARERAEREAGEASSVA